ncbi:MAG: heme ABC transporter permease CcmC [Pseudomonadota bacterium]|nr:heme ABC transporter permease CcmC [Pseudomonadota bacterium]
MLNFFHNSYIYILVEKLINFINSIFFVLLLIALSFALIFSPPDYLQGDSVRIMYVHVPAAWISLASFTCIAILSILNFIFKIKNFKLIAKSIAPIGLMFTCIAIVTGSIWGQPTWGTFWVWDARITSMVVMALFYCLFIAIHKFFNEDDKANKISSVIAIIGLINIPIIKYSVDWWSTLHQPASIKITGTSTIHSSMLMPLLLMFFVLILYCALIFLMKYKTEIIRIKKKNLKRYDQ